MDWLYKLAFQIDASKAGIPTTTADNSTMESIFTGVYMAIAGFATFFIIRGALLYITNGSDPAVNKQARETIIYSVVAILGSTMVFGLIQFVFKVLSEE